LNGRDLIIMEQKGREQVNEIAQDKKKKEDARNVAMKAYGLTNYSDFFQPEVVEL